MGTTEGGKGWPGHIAISGGEQTTIDFRMIICTQGQVDLAISTLNLLRDLLTSESEPTLPTPPESKP